MGNNLYTATSEATARLAKERGDPWIPRAAVEGSNVCGRVITRYWPEIDASVADTLVTTMLGVTAVSDPQADGQTYTGAYAVSDVWKEEGEDRRVTIYQKLTRVVTVTTGSDLPTAIAVGSVDAINDFQLQVGTTNITIYKYLWLHPSSRVNALNSTTVAITPPNGLTELKRFFDVEPLGDRTGTLTVVFQAVIWPNTVAAGTPTYSHITAEEGSASESGKDHSQTTQYFGVANSDADSVIDTLSESTPSGSWVTDMIRYAERNPGEAVITRNRVKINTTDVNAQTGAPATDGLLLAMDISMLDGDSIAHERLFPSLLPATAALLVTYIKANPVFTVGGTSYRTTKISAQHLKSGLMNVKQVGELAVIRGAFPGGQLGKMYFWLQDIIT
ncbi:MAG: hypothetical protein KKD01_20065, partial [Proteobacteria bacterium]|nr:hypothetical protein [Pseudomonadota bacterium]